MPLKENMSISRLQGYGGALDDFRRLMIELNEWARANPDWHHEDIPPKIGAMIQSAMEFLQYEGVAEDLAQDCILEVLDPDMVFELQSQN
jgi:hypothetical protein